LKSDCRYESPGSLLPGLFCNKVYLTILCPVKVIWN
jgi:hypothetical protein